MGLSWRRRARPSSVVLVTRAGCTLCAQAEPVVARAAQDAGVPLEVRDVDADPGDLARWSDKVPVVLLDGVEHAYWTVDERVLRKALRA
jgi:glutaredoxin